MREDPRKGGVWRAFRQIPEAGGRWLRVVYLEKDEGKRIITVFLIKILIPGKSIVVGLEALVAKIASSCNGSLSVKKATA